MRRGRPRHRRRALCRRAGRCSPSTSTSWSSRPLRRRARQAYGGAGGVTLAHLPTRRETTLRTRHGSPRTSTRGRATSSARARPARTCPTPAARSARAGSRRPRTTTSAGFRTAGPHARRPLRGRALHARARRDVLVARRRRGTQGRRPLGGAHRGARRAARRRLRARVREPRRRGRRHDRASARADLRLRLRAGAAAPGARARRALSTTPATGSSRPRRAGAPGCPRRRSSRTLDRSRPDDLVPDLPSLDDAGRDGLAALLVDVLERFDRLFDAQTPYMLWIHQRPFDGGDWPEARLHVEIVSPWRPPACRASSPPASSAPASTTRCGPRTPLKSNTMS